MDILQHVPGLAHVDDGPKSYGKLARTSERPRRRWGAATGQWSTPCGRGNVSLLRRLLDEAKPDGFLLRETGGCSVMASGGNYYDIDDLSCKYDAVIVACGAEASRRCAINLDKER